MSLKEDLKKLKEKLGTKDGGSRLAPQEGPPKVPRPPKDKAPKVEVVYKCGHTQPVGELKNHDCRQCQLEKRKQGFPGQAGKGKGRTPVARLPKDSVYSLQYSEEGEKKWWFGILSVPLGGDGGACFEARGEADSVHYLLDQLAKKWRDWEKSNQVMDSGKIAHGAETAGGLVIDSGQIPHGNDVPETTEGKS